LKGYDGATMMINPVLLENVRSLGPTLQETDVEVLGLDGTSLKKLKTARIFTIEQLARSDETTLLHIPHFGIGKVKRIQTCLNSYLTAVLEGYPSELQNVSESPDIETQRQLKPRKKSSNLASKINTRLKMESLSGRISKLEDRIGMLESRLTSVQ
jgi:hypothetical protein